MLSLAERIYHATQTPYTSWLSVDAVLRAFKWFKEVPYTVRFCNNTDGRDDVVMAVEGKVVTVWIPNNLDKPTRRGHAYAALAVVYLCSIRGKVPRISWNPKTGCIGIYYGYMKEVMALSTYLECHPDHYRMLSSNIPFHKTAPNFGFTTNSAITNYLYVDVGLSPIAIVFYTNIWIDTRPPKPKKKLPKYADGHEDPVDEESYLTLISVVSLVALMGLIGVFIWTS